MENQLENRLHIAQENLKNVNCLGFVYFTLGIKDQERAEDVLRVNVEENFTILQRIGGDEESIQIPREANAIGFYSIKDREYFHFALIKDPTREPELLERENYNKPVRENSVMGVLRFYRRMLGKSNIEMHFLKRKGTTK